MEYDLFEGRYTVQIGDRGKVTVISNVAYGKVLKVNGKLKDNLRYVNMSSCKGGDSEPYTLTNIKDHCLSEVALSPLSEEEVRTILNNVKPSPVLESVTDIEQLEKSFDNYNNVCFVEDMEGYTRYYTKVEFSKRSNGLLKFNYKVSTRCKETHTVTNSKTKVFSYLDKVRFDDVERVSDDELEQVFKLINDERIKRKLEQVKAELSSINKGNLRNDYEYATYCEDVM